MAVDILYTTQALHAKQQSYRAKRLCEATPRITPVRYSCQSSSFGCDSFCISKDTVTACLQVDCEFLDSLEIPSLIHAPCSLHCLPSCEMDCLISKLCCLGFKCSYQFLSHTSVSKFTIHCHPP